jgi:Fe-S-cluster containining protein
MSRIPTDAVATLCPACGLCCNGVLFGDVELRRGDDPERLAAAGLELFAKGNRTAFAQPCACFDGALCRIYAGRPQRCRAFECAQIRRLNAGETSLAAARRAIRAARRHADEVRELVRQLGHTDESLPLNQRYAAVMAEPLDFTADPARLELRGELMLAVARLVTALERDFLAAETKDA